MLRPPLTSPRRFLHLLILLSGFLPALNGHGQRGTPFTDLDIEAYNVEQGLDQSTVYQVLQDQRGLMWLITGGGLQLFDGTSFTSFRPDGSPEETVQGISFHEMAENGSGRLVLSTGPVVMQFDGETGRFRKMPSGDSQSTFLFNVQYRGKPICWRTRDHLCLAGDNRFEPIRLNYSGRMAPPAGFVPAVAVINPREEILLAGPEGCLEIPSPGSGPFPAVSAHWTPFQVKVSSLCADRNGTLYVMAEGGLYTRTSEGNLKKILDTGLREPGCLFVDRARRGWIFDRSRGTVLTLSEGVARPVRFIHREEKHADTLRPTVRAIFEDRAGNLWFCTDGNGLLCHVPDLFRFGRASVGFTRCLAFHAGEILAGTFNNGLWQLAPDLKTIARTKDREGTGNPYFYDLVTDSEGRLWSASSNGVQVQDRQGKTVYRLPMTTSTANFLQVPGKGGWLSTYDELYAIRSDPPSLTFVRKQTSIRELVCAFGSYWIGNRYGLYQADTSGGVLPALMFSDNRHLTAVPVFSILPVEDGIWVGTQTGIACFSPDGKRTEGPACLSGLTREMIYSLALDSLNRIWYAGNRGIGCIPAGRDRIIRFSARNNLQSPEFNSNASLVLPNGNICFGGINGINLIEPAKFNPRSAPPGVRLVSLQVSDTTFTAGLPPEHLTLQINWKQPHLSGKVFNTSYLPGVEYSFRLTGYQESWSKPSPDPSFAFRNLSPGTYTLWARCTGPYGDAGAEEQILTAVIAPPFWKRIDFLAGLFVTLLLLLVLATRRIQELHHRRQIGILERRHAIDRERLRISQDMHDEIGASLTQISILSELARKKAENPAGMMQMVGQISEIAGRVVDDMGEIIWAMNPRNDSLGSFASYLRQHASEYLSVAGLPARLQFPEQLTDLPMSSEQRRNIYLVVKEALHNIVKHAGATQVTVTLAQTGTWLTVTVEDDGHGFDPARKTGHGNGLPGMRRRIADLGGTFELQSEAGRGTRLEFSVLLQDRRIT